jgi:hypothetical protein
MKLVEQTENKRPGRRMKASDELLLRYECLWVDTFRGLRDGDPEVETETIAGGGLFIKGDRQRSEQLYIAEAGRKLRTIRQPKFADTPDEIRHWHSRVQKEHAQFERDMFDPVRVRVPACTSERRLWEALKRADTASQVRRICSRSKIWLKPRLEFPNGDFIEHWPFRRVLYSNAAKFCLAKLYPRYPRRDQRRSSDYRRIEYFARVMAGLTLKLAPSTAVERLRKMKHAEQCRCWRCLIQVAPRFPMSLTQFLAEGNWFRGP